MPVLKPIIDDGLIVNSEFTGKILLEQKQKKIIENASPNCPDTDAVEVVNLVVPPPVRPPPSLEYSEVATIARTMHYHLYKECKTHGQFLRAKITAKYKTLLPTSGQYIWFRAMSKEQVADRSNDWYGNVRCSLDMLDLLKQDKSINMFIVDYAYFGYSCVTRVIVTRRQSFPGGLKLELTKLKHGDPFVIQDGKFMFLSRYAKKDLSWWGNHTVEIVFDLETVGAKNIFSLCETEAVNHYHVNMVNKRGNFTPHRCLIYNSDKRECPSAWCQECMQQVLDGEQDYSTLPCLNGIKHIKKTKKKSQGEAVERKPLGPVKCPPIRCKVRPSTQPL